MGRGLSAAAETTVAIGGSRDSAGPPAAPGRRRGSARAGRGPVGMTALLARAARLLRCPAAWGRLAMLLLALSALAGPDGATRDPDHLGISLAVVAGHHPGEACHPPGQACSLAAAHEGFQGLSIPVPRRLATRPGLTLPPSEFVAPFDPPPPRA